MNNAKVDREIEAEIVTLCYDEKIEVLQEIKNFKKKKSQGNPQYTNKTVMRIWQLEIEKPNSSHYLLSGVTMGGGFM